jgi:hypothetical protein
VFLRIFYTLPDVINYPANFGISTDNLISTDFAYRIIGWLLGIVVVAVAYVAVSKALKALDSRSIGIATAVIVGIIVFVQSMTLVQILLARRIIVRGTVLYSIVFPLTSWESNHTAVFTLGIIVITIVLAGIVIALSLRDAEPYSNPAQHRRNKARWRNKRRWSICLIVCLVFSFGIITVVKDYVNRGPEIVESEGSVVTYEPATVGKLVDKISKPFENVDIILFAEPKYDNNQISYGFYTNRALRRGGIEIPAKTPMGMFKDIFIPNDLKLVADTINRYYGGEESNPGTDAGVGGADSQ